MTKRTYDVRTIRDRAFKTNIDNFDREVSRAARKEGAAAVSSAGRAIKEIRDNGSRIPEVFKIEDMQDMTYSTILSDALKAQEAAEEKFYQDLKPHAEIYIHGLNMEIQRREQTKDAGAINLINEEINRVKDDPQYFGKMVDGRVE